MACYEPIVAFEVKGLRTENGAKVIIFKDDVNHETEPIAIPCGKCLGCRMDYSKQWQARIVKEAERWDNNIFLTLTYNDEHLPMKDVVNTETGEVTTGHPLVPEHFKNFMKRLRKAYSDKFNHTGIRFYACGEYGGRTGRPHYHAALFNIDVTLFKDIKKIGVSKAGCALFTSKKIEEIWGKGFITIGELTPESGAYIARYMLKKQKGPQKEWYYESQGKTPEFTRSSNRHGIAYDYFAENAEKLIESDSIYVPRRNSRPQKMRIPDYGVKTISSISPPLGARLRTTRELKQRPLSETISEHNASTASTKSYWDALRDREENARAKLSKLIRPLE